jgi:glycerol-3-phosphate dehydrogenase (NAD(P)+)
MTLKRTLTNTPSEPAADLNGFREHTLKRGVNPLLYWTLRAILVPFFLLYFRLQRIGREHLPRSGPLLLASNHRSFLDPFVIGTLVRRPVYYMAKRELFEKRWQAWVLNALGAFPVDRGAGDRTRWHRPRDPRARRLRGRVPRGHAHARRAARRAAARRRAPGARNRRAGGAVAVIGSDAVRSGWRIRPRKVRCASARRCATPPSSNCSPALAAA